MSYNPKCKIAQSVMQDIGKRSELMRVKHQRTFDAVDRDILKWLEEAFEEQIDNLMYLKRAIDRFKNIKR